MALKKSKLWTFIYKKTNLAVLILSCGILSSCVTQRNLEYLSGVNDPIDSYEEPDFIDYRLQPNDALYIQINSLDDATANVFTQASGMRQSMDQYSAYLTSYSVSQEGEILLPVIGKIPVEGKTTIEVSEMIKDSITNILNLPTVTVRLVNRYVSILGEVKSPGHYNYTQDKFTVYDAISLAGDITEYGNRRKVMLTRNESGKNMCITVDLTEPGILSSDYYYIQPNDMIYVKPIRKRIWGMEQFPFTIIFSTITTALVLITFIQQQ